MIERMALKKELYRHFPESFATGFEFSDVTIPDASILIIRNFCTNTEGARYSFAFELEPILNAQNMTNKAWITIDSSHTINIPFHSGYKEFEYEGEKFHPYSVALSKYVGSAENLKNICSNIYRHNINHND